MGQVFWGAWASKKGLRPYVQVARAEDALKILVRSEEA